MAGREQSLRVVGVSVSFYHVGSRDETQLVRLSGRLLPEVPPCQLLTSLFVRLFVTFVHFLFLFDVDLEGFAALIFVSVGLLCIFECIVCWFVETGPKLAPHSYSSCPALQSA